MTYIGNIISKVIIIAILVNFLVIVESADALLEISFIFPVRKQTDSRLRSAVHCQDTKTKVNHFLNDKKRALLTIADDYIYEMTTMASTKNPIPWTWSWPMVKNMALTKQKTNTQEIDKWRYQICFFGLVIKPFNLSVWDQIWERGQVALWMINILLLWVGVREIHVNRKTFY